MEITINFGLFLYLSRLSALLMTQEASLEIVLRDETCCRNSKRRKYSFGKVYLLGSQEIPAVLYILVFKRSAKLLWDKNYWYTMKVSTTLSIAVKANQVNNSINNSWILRNCATRYGNIYVELDLLAWTGLWLNDKHQPWYFQMVLVQNVLTLNIGDGCRFYRHQQHSFHMSII